MMRKTLLTAVLTFSTMAAHADYQCSVTPRDDVVLNPQTVQVKGENGNLVITPNGDVTFNGKAYTPSASRRKIIRPSCAARCRGLMKVPVIASKKAAWRWIKLLRKRWEKAAICAVG